MLIIWSILFFLATGDAYEDWRSDYELIVSDGILRAGKKPRESIRLDLSGLWISEVEDFAFENIKVKELDLKSNEIFRIGSSAFVGLNENLEELNLGSNRIRNTNSLFSGMKNLRVLNLSDNPIEFLSPGEFFGIPKEAEIILKDNKLRTLNTAVFEDPESLEKNLNEDDRDNETEDSDEKSDDDWLNLSHNNDVIICIKDSTLNQVRVLETGDSLPQDCLNVFLNRGIRDLNLQNFRIQSVAKGWYEMKKLPVNFLSFSLNNLTEFSAELLNDLPETVAVVDLSNNFIKEIRRNVFQNFDLKIINLEENLIENIEIGSFEFSNILELNLAGNKISDIAFTVSLPKSLKTLNLESNKISEINDAVFSGLENLADLNLARNEIAFVQNNSFDGLSSLKTLTLENNKISKIDAESFLDLPKLEHLSLAGNQISEILPGTTRNLKALIILDVSRNPFDKLKNGAFHGIQKTGCNKVFIADNKIEIIEAGVFENVQKNHVS